MIKVIKKLYKIINKILNKNFHLYHHHKKLKQMITKTLKNNNNKFINNQCQII